MVRIRKITISGFRAARYPLPLDLTGSCRSVAIFGENASGKSTITDGIEWFFFDKVEHLWREDCKEDALRNIHLDDKDDALVSLGFLAVGNNQNDIVMAREDLGKRAVNSIERILSYLILGR